CRKLSFIDDGAPPMASWRIREILTDELGASACEAFAEMEVEPFESNFFAQSHLAWLKSGDQVKVTIKRPGIEKQLEAECELLPRTDKLLCGVSRRDLESVIHDFRGSVLRQLDYSNVAKNLSDMAEDAIVCEMLRAATVHGPICSGSVLTVSYLSEDSSQGHPPEASHLFAAWLRQVFRGRVFPLQPRVGNYSLLPDGKVAFTGGSFGTLSQEIRVNLWKYLWAVARNDPQEASDYLLPQLD